MATVVVEKTRVAGQADKDDVDVGALRVIAACCCSTTSLYCATPNCIGMQNSGNILCIEGDIDPETYSHEQELDAIPQANVGYGAPIEIVTER
eukprot:g11.t1